MELNIPDGDRRRSETVKTVGPQLYVALAAVHFKNHAGSGAAKPAAATSQVKDTLYVLFC